MRHEHRDLRGRFFIGVASCPQSPLYWAVTFIHVFCALGSVEEPKVILLKIWNFLKFNVGWIHLPHFYVCIEQLALKGRFCEKNIICRHRDSNSRPPDLVKALNTGTFPARFNTKHHSVILSRFSVFASSKSSHVLVKTQEWGQTKILRSL